MVLPLASVPCCKQVARMCLSWLRDEQQNDEKTCGMGLRCFCVLSPLSSFLPRKISWGFPPWQYVYLKIDLMASLPSISEVGISLHIIRQCWTASDKPPRLKDTSNTNHRWGSRETFAIFAYLGDGSWVISRLWGWFCWLLRISQQELRRFSGHMFYQPHFLKHHMSHTNHAYEEGDRHRVLLSLWGALAILHVRILHVLRTHTCWETTCRRGNSWITKPVPQLRDLGGNLLYPCCMIRVCRCVYTRLVGLNAGPPFVPFALFLNWGQPELLITGPRHSLLWKEGLQNRTYCKITLGGGGGGCS